MLNANRQWLREIDEPKEMNDCQSEKEMFLFKFTKKNSMVFNLANSCPIRKVSDIHDSTMNVQNWTKEIFMIKTIDHLNKSSTITLRINQDQEDFIAQAMIDYQAVLPVGIKVTKSFIITKLLELGVTAMEQEVKDFAEEKAAKRAREEARAKTSRSKKSA